MDEDPLTRMENLLKSGVSTDKVLQDMINYLRQKESPPKSDTSLEEMIDDFLEAAGNKSEEHFETVEKIYDELKEKSFDDITKNYNYVTEFHRDALSGFGNFTINQIISDLEEDDKYKSVILSYAINYSDLNEIVIDEDISKLNYIGYRFGENGMKKKLIVEGNAGDCCGNRMSDGTIYVKGNIGRFCGREMSGGEIVISGDTRWLCGYMMSAGKIYVNGNVTDRCGEAMSGGEIYVSGHVTDRCGEDMYGGEITVDGEIVGPIGKNKTGGKIINKGNEY